MKITCIIVDDEPVSQEILEKYISDCPGLELIGVCKNSFEASDMLTTKNVQLMFLDINMPRLSGIRFYKSLTDPPYVIFTTAYPEYAIEGFELDAVDYLLKPFPFERFLKAINKLNQKNKSKGNSSYPGYFLLNADKKIHKINFNDIAYLEATGDYVKVCMKERHLVVHETLQELLNMLPDDAFVRIHKSYVISIRWFEYVEGNMVKIADKTLPIGQTFRNDFLGFIGKK